jgi:hypothetical protein
MMATAWDDGEGSALGDSSPDCDGGQAEEPREADFQ